MVAERCKLFLLASIVTIFANAALSFAEDGSETHETRETSEGQQLDTRMCGRYRMMSMTNGNGMPSSPATEAALTSALRGNICASYNPNTMFPFLNLTNLRELGRCKAAAQYLFTSNTKRPDDCQMIFGIRCGQDSQGKMVCMIKTQVGFFTYDEKPLTYCAQNFKPSGQDKPPAPQPPRPPTNPVNPANPVNPNNPLNPANPANPSSPLNPNPNNPLNPVNPNPNNPLNPASPNNPLNPVNPNPNNPLNPVNPSPNNPLNPVNPNPSNPVNPANPNPVNPANPNPPVNPVNPANPPSPFPIQRDVPIDLQEPFDPNPGYDPDLMNQFGM